VWAFSFDIANNHISNRGYNYDAAGELLWDGGSTYEYDAEGRVKLSYVLTNPISQCPAAATPGPWQCPVYNALGQRVEDYQSDAGGNPMTLTYPMDISGQRTGAFAQWPSQNWTGWNVYWASVAGQRLNMGGVDAYIDHADAVGSTTMETDPAGAVQWDVTHYPWGRVFQETGIRQSEVVMGLDWQVNDPVIPSATREFNFRDYRWMTPDPDNAGSDVGDSQSWNMYSYAGNNPTTDSDPSGLDCIHSSPSPGGISVGVESGACSGSGGIYVDGTVDVNSFTYKGSELGYSYAPYSGGSGTGVIGFGAPASSSDLPPLALDALPLIGQWASTGIKTAAVDMALNGALIGAGRLIELGVDSLLAAREGGGLPTIEEPVVTPRPSPPPDLQGLSPKIQKQMASRGWTPQEIDRVYRMGTPSQVVDRTAGFTPATQYIDTQTGNFIVINNRTGNVIQISKPGFLPNPPVK